MSTPGAGPGLPSLRSLGVFADEQFLSAPVCERLARAMKSSDKVAPAELLRAGDNSLVDEKVRSTKVVRVDADLREHVRERFAEAMPKVAAFFGTSLAEFEPPQFLRYGPGDFFQVHQDASSGGRLARRRVSAVVFVTGGGFSGGALKLYGLMKDERWKVLGLPVTPATGLLVAFRSDLLHEVQPVLTGQRLTVVSWYLQ